MTHRDITLSMFPSDQFGDDLGDARRGQGEVGAAVHSGWHVEAEGQCVGRGTFHQRQARLSLRQAGRNDLGQK